MRSSLIDLHGSQRAPSSLGFRRRLLLPAPLHRILAQYLGSISCMRSSLIDLHGSQRAPSYLGFRRRHCLRPPPRRFFATHLVWWLRSVHRVSLSTSSITMDYCFFFLFSRRCSSMGVIFVSALLLPASLLSSFYAVLCAWFSKSHKET